ncbi:MAG: peptide ABC transporter substrate-binding protein, partial [Clostridia bacterium]|nr:peptide ABC transporter substrate-binding protein [Clostridia bacterium]
MSKKILSMLLAALMVVAVVITTTSCDDTSTENSKTESNTSGTSSTTEEVVYTDPFADLEGDERYEAIYNEALGEFLEAYEAAKAETDSLSKRFALMAIAEAKLLESGVMLPLTTRGGNYAISRVAPYTVPSMLWGNDSDRFHDAIVATDLIKAEDRAEMKVKYNELKGTGEYLAWVKTFLTEKGYTTKDSYTIAYSSDPQTWDALATSMAADSEAIVNTYDGLYEYDVEGTLKPALALSHTVTTTGEGDEMRTVYTFKIREGQIWVDSQGRKVADLTANDFVTGMQHMMDAEGGLEYLIQGVIVNASEYIAGDITDFAEVGVKATDDYTLEYTLIGNPTYFLTMLGYNCFAPMNKEYYVAQ